MHSSTLLLRDLVATPGINPMGRPLTGPEIYEHRVSAYLEAFFRDLGVRHERQTVAPLRDNVVAFHEPPGASWTLVLEVTFGPKVILLSTTDVVPNRYSLALSSMKPRPVRITLAVDPSEVTLNTSTAVTTGTI